MPLPTYDELQLEDDFLPRHVSGGRAKEKRATGQDQRLRGPLRPLEGG